MDFGKFTISERGVLRLNNGRGERGTELTAPVKSMERLRRYEIKIVKKKTVAEAQVGVCSRETAMSLWKHKLEQLEEEGR